MAKVYYESDGDLGVLLGRKIAILGYGSQGHAHALSLRDSGADVTVGLRPNSQGWKRAESHGITPVTPQEAVADADVVGLFVPDHVQRQVWDEVVAPALKPGMTVLFAHGFNIHFEKIVPPEDVNVHHGRAEGPRPPRAPPYTRAGRAVPLAIAPGPVRQRASDSRSPGPWHRRRAAPACIETTFREETETDLFGEQAVLCGGAHARSCRRASRRSSRPATRRRWRTSSASTS